MTVRGFKCLMCGDTVISRAQHDFVTCYCGNVSVDGGQKTDFFGVSIIDTNKSEFKHLELDITSDDLYNDYNTEKDKYNLIRDFSFSKKERDAAKAKILLKKHT